MRRRVYEHVSVCGCSIEVWISVFISIIAFYLFLVFLLGIVCHSLSVPGNSGRSSRKFSKRLNF